MKIGLAGTLNEFTTALLNELGKQLPADQVLFWPHGSGAPAPDLEAIISIGPVTRDMLASQPKLGLVQTASDGYDAVDIPAATEMGIWVSYTPGSQSGNADSVAEFAVMLLIAACRQLAQQLHFVANHDLPRPMINMGLSGKSVCLVGFGAIGQRVAARLQPFGARVLTLNRKEKPMPAGITGFTEEHRAEALGQSDAVMVCVRAGASNRHLVDAGFLAAMKPGSVLVNVTRGSVVEEKALVEAIRSGHLGGAGLDVTETEPVPTDDPLLSLPQVVITPHVAGFTDNTLEGTLRYLVEILGRYRAGQRFDSLLNKPGQPRHALKA